MLEYMLWARKTLTHPEVKYWPILIHKFTNYIMSIIVYIFDISVFDMIYFRYDLCYLHICFILIVYMHIYVFLMWHVIWVCYSRAVMLTHFGELFYKFSRSAKVDQRKGIGKDSFNFSHFVACYLCRDLKAISKKIC